MATFNYAHLRYFWAVAHEGNLTRAAASLHVSQSAVSVQIQKLEAELGSQLFERRGKRLILTEAGRITLDYADAIFATGEELTSTLQQRADQARQVLRVGALHTLSRNFQMRFLAPVLGRDDVQIRVQSGGLTQLLRTLEAHQLDVVLANVVPPRDATTAWVPHPIAEQPVSLVASPLRARRRRPLARLLAEEPLVVPSAESSIRTGFDALTDRLGLRPLIVAEVDDMAMLRLLAREDIGYSVVPPIVVKDEIASGQLVELEQLPGLSETFFAITLRRRFPSPLLGTLLDPNAPAARARSDAPSAAGRRRTRRKA